MPIQVLVIDDHEIIRIGLRQMLVDTDITIAGEASNIATGIQAFKSGKFDVVMVDVRFPDGDGLQLLAKIKNDKPSQNSLVFSAYDNPAFIAKAIAAGANGFLSKSDSDSRIIDAIRRSAAGENIWTKDELRKVGAGLANIQRNDSDVPLTIRECEILRHLASGLTNKQIAQSMGLSYETIKDHIQQLLRKIGVSDRTQAAVWAVRRNLV